MYSTTDMQIVSKNLFGLQGTKTGGTSYSETTGTYLLQTAKGFFFQGHPVVLQYMHAVYNAPNDPNLL